MLALLRCNLQFKRLGSSRIGGVTRFFSIYNGSLPGNIKTGRLTHYDVLGVKEDATVREIKEAYLRLVKLYHPDTSRTPDSRVVFICIKDAHEVLINPSRRREYDNTIARHRSPSGEYHSFTTRVKTTGTGYNSEGEDKRWERYKRYTNGERNDKDEPYIASKTIAALCVSGLTIFGLCLFAEEMTTHFKGIQDEDDNCTREIREEELVKAYHNPLTDKWERILHPFVPPTPDLLLSHYKQLEDENIDEQLRNLRIPKKEFVVLEMPFSKTNRPSILYDPRSRKLVIFKN